MAQRATVIEATATTFTAVEIIGGSGNPELRRWASQTLPEEGLTAGFIKRFWQRHKFACGQVVWMVPESLVRFKTLTFIKIPEEQLAAAVKVELETNGNEKDVWRIIGIQDQNEQINVKVALIANAHLQESFAVLKQAGLEVKWSGFKSRGIQNFIFFHQDLWEVETARYAYLYLTEARMDYGVVSETALLYQRSLKLGNADLTGEEAQEAQADLLAELRLSLASSKGAAPETPDRIWLFGNEVQVLEQLQGVLTEAGFEVALPLKMHLGGDAPGEDIPRLAPLLGLALDESDWNSQKQLRIFNLAQQEQRVVRERFDWALRLALAGGLVLLGVWFFAQAKAGELQKQQQWLAHQTPHLLKIRQAQARTRANLKRIKVLEKWTRQENRELDFLLRLQQYLPAETYLTDVTIEEGRVKTVAGTTPSVSLLLTKLSADPWLSKLQLKGNILTTEQGYEGFQLEERTAAQTEQER